MSRVTSKEALRVAHRTVRGTLVGVMEKENLQRQYPQNGSVTWVWGIKERVKMSGLAGGRVRGSSLWTQKKVWVVRGDSGGEHTQSQDPSDNGLCERAGAVEGEAGPLTAHVL